MNKNIRSNLIFSKAAQYSMLICVPFMVPVYQLPQLRTFKLFFFPSDFLSLPNHHQPSENNKCLYIYLFVHACECICRIHFSKMKFLGQKMYALKFLIDSDCFFLKRLYPVGRVVLVLLQITVLGSSQTLVDEKQCLVIVTKVEHILYVILLNFI